MNLALNKETRSKSHIAACFVVILLLAICLATCLSSCKLFASEIVIKDLEIKAEILEDGSVRFTETSKAHFSSQDTNWWNYYRVIDDETLIKKMSEHGGFKIDGDSFYVDGKKVDFVEEALDLSGSDAKEVYTNKYRNQTVGYYFPRRDEGVEIGVIFPEFSSGTHTISYSYTVGGLITGAADTAVFYYQYLSEINEMDVEKMTVTVLFPQAEEDLLSWLHVSKGAVGVWKQSDDKKSATILLEDVSAGEYVESRMLLEKSHFTSFGKETNETSLTIQNQEKNWYDAYMRETRLRLFVTILDYVLAVLAVLFGVFILFRFKRKNKPIKFDNAPIYYREIPEGYTGGEVSPLYFYYSHENYIDESISATMLELVRLHYITITPDEKKKGAVITVLKRDEEDELRTHQKLVVEMLLKVGPIGTPFTMKEFEKYGKNHPGTIMMLVDKYKAAILNKSERDKAYRKENPALDRAQKFSTAMVGTGFAIVVLSGFLNFLISAGMFFFGAGLIIGGLIPYLFLRRSKAPLTTAGQMEYDKLHALARFMQEFSSMDEHEIPELVLWEDYMIFATAMGIADKVADQLEIAYPEFKRMSASNFDASGFLILYFFSHSFRFATGLNFVGNIANVIRSVTIMDKAVKAAGLAAKIGGGFGGGGRGGGSSFHGGGGGFHGGGFGGRR